MGVQHLPWQLTMTFRPGPGGGERDPGQAARASVVLERCAELGLVSEEPGNLTRRPLTTAAREAERLVASWMRDAGGQVTIDPVGNVTGRWRPSGAAIVPVIVIGSHIDTVRDAGRFDGPLGVLLGIALMETLVTPSSSLFPSQPFGIDVVAFAGEEGARFSLPFLGSRMMVGDLPVELLARLDDEAVSFGQALRDVGIDPESVAGQRPAYAPDEVLLYLEPHIEQGPVLDAAGEAIGVVSAIAGQTRRRVTLTGRANHAGTTPMRLRADALAGAAEAVLAVERVARQTPGLVATVGELKVSPGSANVIPGEVTFSLDIRHAVGTTLQQAVRIIIDAIGSIAGSRGLGVDVDGVMDVAPVACDPRVIDAIHEASRRTFGSELREVVSGAGHDAMVMATIAPVGMFFVRSPGGISHHPDESVIEADVAVALGLLVQTVQVVAERVRSGDWHGMADAGGRE